MPYKILNFSGKCKVAPSNKQYDYVYMLWFSQTIDIKSNKACWPHNWNRIKKWNILSADKSDPRTK